MGRPPEAARHRSCPARSAPAPPPVAARWPWLDHRSGLELAAVSQLHLRTLPRHRDRIATIAAIEARDRPLLFVPGPTEVSHRAGSPSHEAPPPSSSGGRESVRSSTLSTRSSSHHDGRLPWMTCALRERRSVRSAATSPRARTSSAIAAAAGVRRWARRRRVQRLPVISRSLSALAPRFRRARCSHGGWEPGRPTVTRTEVADGTTSIATSRNCWIVAILVVACSDSGFDRNRPPPLPATASGSNS
jgi:hypothetical protein